MPTGSVMPYPRIQFFDTSGNPLASGTLETYEAGTTTALATYSDVSLSVANPTTITLNAAGRPAVSGTEVSVFLAARAYKFVLKNSAGTTIWTADNIYALQPATSVNLEIDGTAGEALAANDLCYLSDGSGSKTAGRWYKADADLIYGAITPQLAFATAAIASGASGVLRTGGRMTGLSGLTAGTTYYVSATAGALTSTAPTYARIVGQADAATSLVMAPNPAQAGILERTTRINAATPYALTWPSADAAGMLVSDGAGTLSLQGFPLVAEGRLTGTTATPVTTADVSGATAIYYTPYNGSRIALYDGTRWNIRTFTELTIDLTGFTASRPYDIFAYDNAGTVTIETLIWTNATTRATALTTQNGVYVKTGAVTRRYLGTVYVNATGGQTDDSLTKRFIFNAHNRAWRPLRVHDSTDSWTYTTASFQQANAAAANKVEVMVGLAGVTVDLSVIAAVSNSTPGTLATVGIGEDSTSALATEALTSYVAALATALPMRSELVKTPAVGYHYYAWLEYSAAAGTATWYGDAGGASVYRSGLRGWVEA